VVLVLVLVLDAASAALVTEAPAHTTPRPQRLRSKVEKDASADSPNSVEKADRLPVSGVVGMLAPVSRYRPPTRPGSKFITAEGHTRLATELDQLWRIERPAVTRSVS